LTVVVWFSSSSSSIPVTVVALSAETHRDMLNLFY